jgi:ABC-type multidrug transport system fused ATPase/permease subunit
MLDRQSEQLERVLNDVLTNDIEIKRGVEASDLDVENLRDGVMRRKDEVWDTCLAEQNAVAALETERLQVQSKRSQLERRSWNLIAGIFFYSMPYSIITTGVLLFIYGYRNRNMGLKAYLTSGSGLISISFTVFGVPFLLWLRFLITRNRRAYVRRLDMQLQDLDSSLQAANSLLEQALREKGVRGMLREIINVRDPSYAQILQVQQAAGLAELRDPLYEIRTSAKERIHDLLVTMPCGSIGVSGPRGCGKTTLLRYFCSPSTPAVDRYLAVQGGSAGEQMRAATVDDPVLCRQPKIRRWPQATA